MPCSRLIAVGDVHGCAAELRELLRRISPTADDTFVFLGDYVDRGPDTAGVIEQILQLTKTVAKVVALRGNHDEWMLDACKAYFPGWLGVGGTATLQSYHPKRIAHWQEMAQHGATTDDGLKSLVQECLESIPVAHLRFLEDTTLFHRQDGFIFVHAGLDPLKPLHEQDSHTLLMGTSLLLYQDGYRGRETVVFGHKGTSKLRDDGKHLPYVPDELNVIGLDTSAHQTGVLTAMDVRTRQVWQTARAATG